MTIRTTNGEAESRPIADSEGRVAEGTGYLVFVSDDMTVSGAVACLSETMELLSTHPNISPVELQGAVMGAMMGGGA